MSNTSESKLLADAQATLARATQKEHAGQLDAAYQLYVQAAKELVPLTGKSYRLETRNSAKTFGSRALERANLLKHATQGELRRVQRDPLSEEEQSYILKQSSRVNGITLPIWSSNVAQGQEETRSQVFIDGNGAPQLSPAHSSAAAQWKRPPSELPMVDLDTPDEIVQDVVSDCSVIAALGVCAEHRQRFNSCLAIRAIHPQNEHGVPFRNAQGKYTIRMMFNGTWRMLGLFSPVTLVIDELLPTAPDGRLICATTVKQAQLWPALLEKAYMKLMGGYDFPGSNSSIDLHVLTSWIPEHMYLTGDDFQREKSWKRIYDGFVNGKALLTLGTGETVNGEGHWKDILIAAHNYAIVGLEDDGAVQNLKVLNPWRRTDESQGGGLLTISWGLVCNLFESVYLNWDPELFPHSKVIHGMWRERTAESGEHAASNHHYRLRYSSPESVVASQPPEIWVLLTRHVLSKETKADFIALHHFAHGEAGKFPRADQVPNKGTYSDSPHILARIKDAAPNEVISLIAARDGSTPETGYTLSVYSHASVEVEAVTKVLGYIKTANGTFTSKTAGGNASLATFMNNPQYRVRISEPTGRGAGGGRARVPVKLTVEGARTLPLNVKLVWSGGKRVSDVVIGDIVIDSGAYNFGLACVEGEVQAGEYTLVISSFRAGQLGEYAFRVECEMPIEVTQLPPEGAGMFHKPTKGCWDSATAAGGPSSGNYDANPAFEITVPSPIQLSARLQMISKPPLSPAPALNLTLFERTAQGSTGKQVATSGAYSDALSGVMLPDISLRPVIVNVAISCARPHGSRTINDRATYHAYARDSGMCHRRDNPQRTLVVPGPEVVSRFSVCQGRNEFGELVSDTSGSVYCNGTLLHLWNDARDHVGDSKTFVDRASDLSGTQINMALNNMLSENSFTVSEFLEKMEDRFELNQPGQELREYENARFPHTPPVILGIRPQAKLFRAWTKIVHHYWNNLDRTMVQNCFNGEDDVEAQLLPGPGSRPAHASFDVSGYPAQFKEQCATSIIRLEHPFVIAGGRFREQYYWDSFFVMEGLLAANMTYLARTTLLNFMDEIRSYGFIPNGGRKYYLNRSQPPLFTHMLHAYVHNTNDTAVLHGALPLAEKELRWWAENRSVQVKSPHNSAIVHTVYHYNVEADGPRPESYAEDWRTAWCDTEPPTRSYESAIYSELASGAESGWDYTARWMGDPSTLSDDLIEQMRRVRIRRLVPVDLNSIHYRCHVLMAELYQRAVDDDSPYAWQHKQRHERAASLLKTAVLDLHWDETKAGFYDFEMDEARSAVEPRTGRIGTFWSGATFAPFWSGIWPNSVSANQDKAMQAFAGMRDLLRRYEGPLPATVTKSGQQWDFPNAWPPLQYIAIKALQNIPYNLSTADAFKFAKTKTPESQLGVEYDQLPVLDGENITGRELDGTTSSSWRNVMLKEMAMRYMTAAFCNWNVTGKLRDDDVETIVKDDPTEDAWLDQFPGAMYEKLNAWDVTRSGHGGEYEIQTGFGWTNGVAIWIAHVLGAKLDNPVCPGLGPGQSFSRSGRGYARPSVLDTSPQPQQPLGV